MEVKFVEPKLRQIEQINCEALAIPFFSNERPLHGAFGVVDWRMCGFISRMMIKRHISGEWKESVLIPGRPRIGIEKLFLFGLGRVNEFSETVVEEISAHILHILTQVSVRTSALVLPGRSMNRIEPSKAIEIFLTVASSHHEHDIVFILETPEAQKQMEPVVEKERRKARALLF